METNAVWVKVDGKGLAKACAEAREGLAGTPAEVVMDFSSVQRIDSSALRAMESLADSVDGKGTKLVLSNVNIGIYKVLKLMKLAPRFAYRT